MHAQQVYSSVFVCLFICLSVTALFAIPITCKLKQALELQANHVSQFLTHGFLKQHDIVLYSKIWLFSLILKAILTASGYFKVSKEANNLKFRLQSKH